MTAQAASPLLPIFAFLTFGGEEDIGPGVEEEPMFQKAMRQGDSVGILWGAGYHRPASTLLGRNPLPPAPRLA